jgi:hypothetical protein
MVNIRFRKAHVLVVFILVGAGAVARSVAANAPCDQYSLSNDGTTVSDNFTGLVWQRTSPLGTYTWNQAMTYCNENQGNLPGCDWRLPSVTELQTLVDDSALPAAIDETAFLIPNSSATFWTSTPAPAAAAWVVVFFEGMPKTLDQGDLKAVLCVRSPMSM